MWIFKPLNSILLAGGDPGREIIMSRLTGSKSKYRERHKQGHEPSGLNGASKDFEQADHALVREGCGAARCAWLVRHIDPYFIEITCLKYEFL